MADAHPRVRRWLFVATIAAGSFLLFLVQPMVARMTLPRLGGAPNVWNSALLVYQALLLGGYAYAHAIGRFPLRRQGLIHIAVLLLGGLTLPLALADIAPPAPGWEALWVPWLFVLTVGPAFLAVSAQAPLMQRWFAAHPASGNPYPLYAASNLGSFAGLLAYPLLAEPLLTIGRQSFYWAIGYVLLIALVVAAMWARRHVAAPAETGEPAPRHRSDRRTVALWLALAAVPSGLMLSTTTFLTTDIMAIPLLWVIPLGLYLLSFVIAFAARRALASLLVFLAPVVLLVDGSLSMFAAGRADLLAATASVMLLFVVATALHARLYDARPPESELTRFYLVMALGGALGGLLPALIAPVVFDWTWEHPLLLLAAALLLPLDSWRQAIAGRFSHTRSLRLFLIAALALLFAFSLAMFPPTLAETRLGPGQWAALGGVLVLALVLAARRWSFVAGVALLLLAFGGIANLRVTAEGLRERSYFGIYSVRTRADGATLLMHGTTIHGIQRTETTPREPTAYYGRTSGVGRALAQADADARVGVVGLGVGTLACYRREGQDWIFFEIDPVVRGFSDRGLFTYLADCAPQAEVVIGDARIALEGVPPASFDVLVIDAFSSDAIPLHLMTDEAMGIYLRALKPGGLLLMHVSNNYIRLQPVVARVAEERRLATMLLADPGNPAREVYPSTWIALSPRREALVALARNGKWEALPVPRGPVWTDDYASILPYLAWENFL
ncbi:fused MFS/spermidine synthase [Aurantiacibacter luteus]|uniref:Spermidine synthase n=1 Tax=Aurantiacibacter luteus TaxID=1581420 RepID=A0A0G9MUV3_9SPHN|nr:fused MFS/spermidine synthase [Aurantiacibacter luteus]KLE34344.1 hypothetical protein AAW00_08875 [Aurantiacibacter luteus]